MESSEVPIELLKVTGRADKYLQITEETPEIVANNILERLKALGVNEFAVRVFSEDRAKLALLSGTDRLTLGIISSLDDDDSGNSISTPRKEKDLAIMRERGLKPEEVLWVFPVRKGKEWESLKVPTNSVLAIYRREELEEINPQVFFKFKGDPNKALALLVGRKPLVDK